MNKTMTKKEFKKLADECIRNMVKYDYGDYTKIIYDEIKHDRELEQFTAYVIVVKSWTNIQEIIITYDYTLERIYYNKIRINTMEKVSSKHGHIEL